MRRKNNAASCNGFRDAVPDNDASRNRLGDAVPDNSASCNSLGDAVPDNSASCNGPGDAVPDNDANCNKPWDAVPNNIAACTLFETGVGGNFPKKIQVPPPDICIFQINVVILHPISENLYGDLEPGPIAQLVRAPDS